ncbi:uncharacterized protein LOC111339550, partial [Stylophora pistillata]
CGLVGYQFSALRNGEQCWCSDSLDMSSIVGEPQCNEPCTGNIVLRCGGRESYSVYQALGNYNFSFEVTVPESTFVYERITATYSSYPGASYTLDFGEDVVFTTQNTSVSYIYHTDGQHSGYGRVLLGEYGEAQTKFTSWAVNVHSRAAHFELNCPPAVEANEEFHCPVKVYQGSNMHLDIQFTGGNSYTTPLDDAISRLVGENFQIEARSALSQSSNKTILIPSYRFEEDGKLMGWRICSQTSGFVSLQAFRPVCGKGTYNKYCYSNSKCAINLTPCANLHASTCTSSQVFSTATGTCTDENMTPQYMPSAALGEKYELVIESHVFLSKPGCHIFQFDDVKNCTDVKEGDILGFTYYGQGFAEITSRNSGDSRKMNATAFTFGDLQPSLGSIITTASNSPSESQIQYAIAAIQQLPSLFWFTHNYSIGSYNEEATVRGPHNTLKDTTTIVATEGVANVTWTTPKAVATNATYTITIHPHKGYNVTYVVDFGAGKNNTMQKIRLDTDLPSSYVYHASGSYRISLYVINMMSFQIKACYVTVQDIVLGEYTVIINVSNWVSNASIEDMAVVELPLKGVTCNVIHANRDIEVNETVTVEITVSQGTNADFFIDFGDGSVTTTRELRVQHSYSYYAFFNVSISAYNNVSRENASQEIQVHKPVKPLIGFNVTCPHTNLTDNVPCMLNITGGTDFRCTWNWADHTTSETHVVDLGNFTYHNYSAVGHYNVALNCTNRLYNTTAETTAIVEVPILGFNVDDPIAKPFQKDFTLTWRTVSGTDAIYNLTFTHVIDGASFNVTDITTSKDKTSGSAVITSDMMPLLGFYELMVTAINYVTPRQTICLTVMIDVPITTPVLTRASKFVEVHIETNFSFSLKAGSNVSLWWNFTDGSLVIQQNYLGPFPVDGMTIEHTFHDEGEYIVHLFGNNSVSNFTSVIPVFIQNPPNLTLTSNSPQEIPLGTITFTIAVKPGEEPPTDANYTVHYGDGSTSADQPFSAPLVLQNSYQDHGAYVMNITVANQVQFAFLETEVEVQTPIAGLQTFLVHTGPEEEEGKPGKGPGNTYFPNDFPVMFSTSIRNGTNVSYFWDFDDGESVTTVNTSLNHTFKDPGRYEVRLIAENAISRNITTRVVNMQRMIKISTFQTDGSQTLGKLISFEVVLDEAGTDSCFFVNISGYKLMNFKNSKSCPSACGEASSKGTVWSNPKKFSWTQECVKVGVLNVTVTACNLVHTIVKRGEGVCTQKQCKFPNVTMKTNLVGQSPENAVGYPKKKGFKISNVITLDCEATDQTEFHWQVNKMETSSKERSVSVATTISLTAPSLDVPARGISEYGVFRLIFSVAMVNVTGVVSFSYGYIKIEASDIEAVIDQGTSRAVGQGKDTTVSSLKTSDPDEVSNSPSDFQFCWFCAKKGSYDPGLLENCTQLDAYPLIPIPISDSGNDTNSTSTELDEDGCFGYPKGRLNTSEPSITFNTLRMAAFTDYEVCVQVGKDTRKSTACITLQMTAGDPPEVAITCSKQAPNCGRKINPSVNLNLIGNADCDLCGDQTAVAYLWIISVKNGDDYVDVSNPAAMVATPLDGKTLAVKPDKLKGGKTYKFRLESWVISTKKQVFGFAEYEKEVNMPPQNGRCDVFPKQGFALQPDFRITCSGWSDDTKLIYSVTASVETGQAELPISPAEPLSMDQTYSLSSKTLPVGLAQYENYIDVIITIKDEDDADTKFIVKVQVKMPAGNAAEISAKLDEATANIDVLISSGDPDAALNAIGGVASAMSAQSAQRDSAQNEEVKPSEEEQKEQKERKEMLVGILTKIPPPSNPEDALKITGALEAINSGPKTTLSSDAKGKMAETMSKCAGVLHTPMSSKKRETLAKSLVTSISAVLILDDDDDDDDDEQKSSEDSTEEKGNDEDEKAKQKTLDVTSLILSTAGNSLVTGEEFKVESSDLSLKAKKESMNNVKEVQAGGSKIKGLGTAVDKNSSEPVQMQMSSFSGSPFSKSAGKVDSGVTQLELKDESGNPKNISNLTSYMDIFIPAKNGLAKLETHTIKMSDMLVMQLNVTNNKSAIYVWGVPEHNNTQTVVFCKRGSKPSTTDYDFRQAIPNDLFRNESEETGTSENSTDAQSDPQRYQMFLDNDDLNQTASGVWFIGFYYNGSVKTNDDETLPAENKLNITIFESTCKYYNTINKTWDYHGCKAGPQTTPTERHCRCNHLTSFASDFFVPPNKIDWDKVSLEELFNNPLVFSVVCGIFGLYFLLVLWARRADRKDLEKVGVAPLPDNDPRDTYMYEVVVYTGYSSHAGTSSEIRIVLTGGLDETSPRRLKDAEPGRRKFCRGNVDYFLLSVPRCLGKLKTLRIWQDNTGNDPSWYLLRIMVHDVQSDIKTWFICDRWLAVEEDDGCVERVLTPASKEELTSFNLLFSTEARKNFTDGHLWFSVITRPAKSNFTRVQRLSCCLSILLCTMLANAMFYQVGTESSSGTSVHIGPFSFSIKQLSIGITSSLVVLPVNVLIVTFFRKARPAEAKKGLDKDQDPNGQSPKYEISGEKTNQISKEPEAAEKEDDEKKKENKKKKKKTLPHFFVYISYVLVFISCTVSATFTVFYGLTFGKEKSAGWLSSMMISFWQDVLISQPLKVFAAAMFFAVVIKDPNKAEEENEQEANELNADEEAIHTKSQNSEEEKTLRKIGFVDKPPNEEKLEYARRLKVKQKAMKVIIREIVQYFVFLSVLLVVAYGSRDPMGYQVTSAMRDMFEEGKYSGLDAFDEISDYRSYWEWAQQTLIPTLTPRFWYGPIAIEEKDITNEEATNSDTKRTKHKKVVMTTTTGSKYDVGSSSVLFSYEGKFVADHSTAYLIGTPRLRQLRIQKNKCKLLPTFNALFDECNLAYDWDYEDKEYYEEGWVPMPSNTSTEEMDPTPWTYQTQWKLKGTPYWGQFATYLGGGYVADFGAKRDEAEEIAKKLSSLNWIDRHTRAIFAEFAIYNAQTNFFCVITLLSEILPSGGYYLSPRIQTIRLYRYVGPEMVFVMACELGYMAFLLYFLYKQVKKYRSERREYFKDPWNYSELLVLGFSLSAVGLYFARLALTKYSLRSMQDEPNKFVSFQYVAFVDEWVSATTAMAVFFSVLKFLRLLKFNRRVSTLMITIKLASKPLSSFMLLFFILFLAFAQFAFVVFGINNEDYASFPRTLGSMMSLTLGSFDFDSLTSSSRILGPMFFFSYVVIVLFVLMNVFIGILNDALSEVSNDSSIQSNEHEILDFMLHTFKRTVGKQVGPAIKPNYKEPKNQFELNLDSIEEISENVQYALRNICMEDIRQTNWFEPENTNKKKQIVMMLVLETDEDFTENDICDSIPVLDDLMAKHDESELLRKLIYYREEKRLEEEASQNEDDQSGKSSDDDEDDQSEDDLDSDDDNASVASGDSESRPQKQKLRFVEPADAESRDGRDRGSARSDARLNLQASGTSEV